MVKSTLASIYNTRALLSEANDGEQAGQDEPLWNTLDTLFVSWIEEEMHCLELL